MLRSAHLRLLAAALVAGGGATLASAQATNPIAAPAQKKEAAPIAPTPRTRAISSDVAAQLMAAAPKYTPPPPKPAEAPKPAGEPADAREVDKPRNGIIRLSPVIVNEQRPAIFNERTVNTNKGLKSIAVRRYISEADRAMNRFAIPLFNPITVGNGDSNTEKRALAMYAEDERLRNMSEMKDAANTVSQSDAAQGALVRRESQKTYMRTNDFGWNGGAGIK